MTPIKTPISQALILHAQILEKHAEIASQVYLSRIGHAKLEVFVDELEKFTSDEIIPCDGKFWRLMSKEEILIDELSQLKTLTEQLKNLN